MVEHLEVLGGFGRVLTESGKASQAGINGAIVKEVSSIVATQTTNEYPNVKVAEEEKRGDVVSSCRADAFGWCEMVKWLAHCLEGGSGHGARGGLEAAIERENGCSTTERNNARMIKERPSEVEHQFRNWFSQLIILVASKFDQKKR